MEASDFAPEGEQVAPTEQGLLAPLALEVEKLPLEVLPALEIVEDAARPEQGEMSVALVYTGIDIL